VPIGLTRCGADSGGFGNLARLLLDGRHCDRQVDSELEQRQRVRAA
jgi:hypothetical protein